MKSPAIAALAALCFAVATADRARAALPERSDRVVSYRIEASLDHPSRTVKGRERVTWRNTTRQSVGEIHLHLYLNAFKNEKTTFMKESKGVHRGSRVKEGEWGYIDLERLSLPDGTDLMKNASFIQPDDGNEHDETVLRVPLPDPVPSGGEIAFEADFTSRLPRVFARTGYRGDFYLVGQWFPKLGVFENAGVRGREKAGWNCHQFHANGEFYADFGSYDVTIEVPSEFKVGATGALSGPPGPGAGGRTTYRFTQDDVHDFAWTADPDYIVETRTFSYAAERDPDEERRMARILGLDGSSIPDKGAPDISGVPPEIRLSDVEVTVLIHPEHAAQIDRHFGAAFNGIRYFGYWYGRYPYRTLTVVDPAYGARGAGGMEYPTFITAGTSYVAPAGRLSPEGVTVHEFGHQFWYGLVATNEFEEAWLDEGFNTYSTGKVLQKAYGPNQETIEIAGVPFLRFALMSIPRDPSPSAAEGENAGGDPISRFLFLRWMGLSNDTLQNAFRDVPFVSFPGAVPVHEPWGRRRRYLFDAARSDEMLRASWDYFDNGSYRVNAYDKPALTLWTLEEILGEEVAARAMRLYHERHRFQHPSSDDFIATVSEAAGRDMRWYFDQTVRGSGVLDYAIVRAEREKAKKPAGVFGPPASRKTVRPGEGDSAPSGEKEFEVKVRRAGEVQVPVRIELLFDDGRLEAHDWDGRYRWTRIRGKAPAKLVAARVEPERPHAAGDGFALDASWSNNARTAEADRWPALKWWTRLVTWAQHVLFFYSGVA